MNGKQWFYQFSFLYIVFSFLTACSQTGDDLPYGSYTLAPKRATSRPYKIKGIWYAPQPHYEYEECGIASYYGGGDVFHGRPTATGETFDMNGITAAHKTLPLPCIVQVVNLENGRQLNVKVNDRGPFIPGRIIDVSRRVAQLLGFEGKGTAQVRVRTLVPESLALACKRSSSFLSVDPQPTKESVSITSPSQSSSLSKSPSSPPKEILSQAPSHSTPPLNKALKTGIFVDVGGYPTSAQAQAISHALTQATSLSIQSIEKVGQNPYVIRVGPFPNISEANFILDQVGETGHTSRLVILHP